MNKRKSHVLYRHFDKDGLLLYIGITSGVNRHGEHLRNSEWKHEIANITIERFPSRESLIKAEAKAIKAESPRYNVAHASLSVALVDIDQICTAEEGCNQAMIVNELHELLSGCTQSSLSRAMGITPQYLHDVLNGRRAPGPKILEYLGLEKRETFVKVK